MMLMKKLFAFLIISILFLSGCSGNAKGGLDNKELQKKVEELEFLHLELQEEVVEIYERFPKHELNDFIRVTNADLKRTEDLLNKLDGLETVYATINSIEEAERLSFEVKIVDINNDGTTRQTDNIRKIEAIEALTPYAAGQSTLTPVTIEDFLEIIKSDISGDNHEVFTFKLVNNKVVQVYQGFNINGVAL